MHRLGLTGALLALTAVLGVAGAAAKDFRPGDLRVCGRTHCMPVLNRRVLQILSSYYYGPTRIRRAPRVSAGARGFVLRYHNGYASSMVAGRRLDRFQAYGFFCGRFARGGWYRFPAPAVRELRKLTAGLDPLRVPRRPPPSC